MAFGAGVLISALAFELTAEAYKAGGLDSTSAGLALGSLAFFAGDRVLDRMGGANRKRSSGPGPGGAAAGIVLGAVLDGIPESVAIGVSLLAGRRRERRGRGRRVPLQRAGVAVGRDRPAGDVVAGADPRHVGGRRARLGARRGRSATRCWATRRRTWVAGIQAFAAGAILTMLADTMFPEAFEAEGRSPFTGVVTTLGFALAALLSTL